MSLATEMKQVKLTDEQIIEFFLHHHNIAPKGVGISIPEGVVQLDGYDMTYEEGLKLAKEEGLNIELFDKVLEEINN